MATAPATPYIGLARQYRPQTFADLVGQDQIANSLTQQVLQGKVAQAYLFCGPRGIGKTSAARILAKALNCVDGPTPTPCGKCEQCRSVTAGNSMDVIEIDGASNNSVDNIRELQETISQNPFSARKKIYIIDEVHMLSKGAFNALLKTLEEPPPFVIFIFATTEAEKIPETIKSRCQSFQFTRISIEDLIRRLDFVAQAEEMDLDPGERHAIFEVIAFAVDGGMRDAMMALDQLRALGDGFLKLDEVVRFLGVVEHDQLLRTVEMVHQRDTRGLIQMVADLVEKGRDLERFVRNLLSFLRDLMVLKSGGGDDLVNLTGEKMERAKALLWKKDEQGRLLEVLSYAELLNLVQIFMSLEGEIKGTVQVRIHLEFAFVKLTALEPVVDIAGLLKQFDSAGGGGGTPVAPAAPAPGPPVAPPPAPSAPAPASPPKPGTPDLFTGAQRTASAPTDLSSLDPVALWQQLLAARQQLGMGLSVALSECECNGIDNGKLLLSIPRRSMSAASLNDPAKRAKVESLLAELAGMPVGIGVNLTAETPAVSPRVREPEPQASDAPPSQAEAAPVMRDTTASVPPQPSSPATTEDAYALYLKQDPNARSREALTKNPEFREKVQLVQRFFEGRVFDLSGQEIALD